MLKSALAAIAILGHLALVSAQTDLPCYICTGGDNCVSHTTAEIYDCYNEVGENPYGAAVSCFSAFINYTGVLDFVGNPRDSETGVYRGCAVISPSLGDYCSWYSVELSISNITVSSCETCNTTKCNRHTFNLDDGSITGVAPDGNGSYVPAVSLILFIFCVAFILISK